MSHKKIGIALGGGGTRGFAHLGVLKALEEKGIKIDVVSGTSAGAIVGSLIAAGKTPEKAFELMKENELTDFAKIKLPVNGFMSLENMGEKLKKMLSGEDFNDLKLPFYTAVTNILTGEVEYISEGNVVKAVKASSSIPIIFSPVEINGQLYVDGGLLDNVPVKPLEDCCDYIIAVEIMPLEQVEKVEKITDIAERIFHISVKSLNEEKLKICDKVIKVGGLEGYNILDSSHADEIYEIGYNHAKDMDFDI
ncbi:MAG: patatin-like phospholipase family protein [Bacillota bacterium]|nr:patatin-like phospholipase family protein [Bacillota bacterium]